jgi:hypothetical protein
MKRKGEDRSKKEQTEEKTGLREVQGGKGQKKREKTKRK